MAKRVSEELAEWTREIEIARFHRKKRLTDWVYWEGVYNDKLWGGAGNTNRRRSSKDELGHIPQLNELENLVLNILPSVLYNDPSFEFVPIHPEWDWSAGVWELFADYIYGIQGLEDDLEEITVDTLILGSGVHKSGYAYEVADASYQLGDASTGDPEIRNDMVFSDWVSPMNLLIDYRVTRWNDLRWVAQEIRKPLEEVKANKIYGNTANLQGTESSVGEVLGNVVRTKEFGKKRKDSVKLIEIHDLENGKIITIAEKHDKFLRRDDDYGMPLYSLLTFSPSRPKMVWGKSISQSIEEHVINESKTLAYMAEHGRRAGLSRWMYDKNRVDRDAVEKMKGSADFAAIGVENLERGTPIEELRGASMSMDWQMALNVSQSIVRMLSGVSMQERGRHEPGIETAYEVAKIGEASDRRNKARVKKIDKFIARVIEKQLRIVSDTWPKERILSSLGIPAEYAYRLLPFDNIRVKVKCGSTALEAQQEELRKITTFTGLVGQVGVQVNPEGFVKVLANALDLDYRQIQLLLQTPPQQMQGGQAGGSGGGQQGATPNQILGQLSLPGVGGR